MSGGSSAQVVRSHFGLAVTMVRRVQEVSKMGQKGTEYSTLNVQQNSSIPRTAVFLVSVLTGPCNYRSLASRAVRRLVNLASQQEQRTCLAIQQASRPRRNRRPRWSASPGPLGGPSPVDGRRAMTKKLDLYGGTLIYLRSIVSMTLVENFRACRRATYPCQKPGRKPSQGAPRGLLRNLVAARPTTHRESSPASGESGAVASLASTGVIGSSTVQYGVQ